jgi:hypothetical protein
LIGGRGVSAASRSQQFHRLEQQLRRPVRPPVPQIEHNLTIRREVQAIGGDRWTQRVPSESLEPRPIPLRHDDGRVQIEAVPPRVTRSTIRRRQRAPQL